MAKSALKAMSLTENFAPVVLLVGHGSTTTITHMVQDWIVGPVVVTLVKLMQKLLPLCSMIQR